MADFEELMGQIRPLAEGETPVLPSTVVDELAQHWQSTTTALEGATVRLSERDERIAALAAENSRLKGENYDLVTRIPETPGNRSHDDDNNPPRPSGIAGLFQPRKK